jgi:hypothetical protein
MRLTRAQPRSDTAGGPTSPELPWDARPIRRLRARRTRPRPRCDAHIQRCTFASTAGSRATWPTRLATAGRRPTGHVRPVTLVENIPPSTSPPTTSPARSRSATAGLPAETATENTSQDLDANATHPAIHLRRRHRIPSCTAHPPHPGKYTADQAPTAHEASSCRAPSRDRHDHREHPPGPRRERHTSSDPPSPAPPDPRLHGPPASPRQVHNRPGTHSPRSRLRSVTAGT